MPNTKIVIESYADLVLKIGDEAELDQLVLPHLLNPKDRKLMSKQDKLALVASSVAWKKNTFHYQEKIQKRTGIYCCVGILPFEDAPLKKLAQTSEENGKFSYQKFSSDGFNSMNPLLTFKCLPNMPLFHISFNLQITGSYFMSYPGTMDFLHCLSKAEEDLDAGLIDVALIVASGDQNNVLVHHHLQRLEDGLNVRARDCSVALVISKRVPQKGDYFLTAVDSDYKAYDPFTSATNASFPQGPFYGPAQLGIACVESMKEGKKEFSHQYIDVHQSSTTISMELFHE